MRAALLTLLLTPLGVQAAEDAPQIPARRLVLVLQDYDPPRECFDWVTKRTGPCGLLIEKMLNYDERKFRKRMEQDYADISHALPQLDIPAFTRQTFCGALDSAEDACQGP